MAVRNVLVVGGGITGSVLAVALAQRGVEVELAEISPVWTGIGHGITIQGNALRCFAAIGVLDEVLAQGCAFDTMRLRAADGSLLAELPTPHTGGPDLPSTLGSLRSALQAILCRAVYAAGVTVRLGTSVRVLTDDGRGVSVEFTDGSRGRYDLVVGADGIRSQIRRLIGIGPTATPVGMGIWRVVAARPAGVSCSEMYYGGERFKVGYSPISADLCYAFILDGNEDAALIGERPAGAHFRQRSAGYGGPWAALRDGIADVTPVNYQWIESILVPDPWYRGRVIVIGDAAHACPPLIAQGAAQCTEDAVVLAETVTTDEPVDLALKRFMSRRMPRVAMVLDNSMRLAALEMGRGDGDPGEIMTSTLTALEQPC